MPSPKTLKKQKHFTLTSCDHWASWPHEKLKEQIWGVSHAHIEFI